MMIRGEGGRGNLPGAMDVLFGSRGVDAQQAVQVFIAVDEVAGELQQLRFVVHRGRICGDAGQGTQKI